MKIVVIGLGSMGKRRVRLLCQIIEDLELYGIDGREDRCEEAIAAAAELGKTIQTYHSIDEVAKAAKIDAAVISTSPLSHNAIIHECLLNGWNVFTELNLVADGYDENMALAKEKNLLLYLSSTPMFRNETNYITRRVSQNSKPLSYIYHIGQYLPDWHPWESYKDFFIGQKKTNGCREILAVELPWMERCFGKLKKVQAVSMRQTELDIDFNDNYNILVTHESGHKGVLVVDVVCRKPVRYFEVYGEELYITWDGSTKGLKELNLDNNEFEAVDLYSAVSHREGYNSFIIENAYEAELRDFFAALEGTKEPEYSFEKDKAILAIIDEVEACVD